MPEFEFVEQGSAEWLAMRRGVVTGSQAHRVTTVEKSKTYAMELAAQKLAREMPEQAQTRAMLWGHTYEPAAAARYAMEFDCEPERVGFAWLDGHKGRIGCSPDYLIGSDGAIEIKCPNTKQHIDYAMNGPPPEYAWQCRFVMMVCKLKWCDFISYDPRVPPPADFYRFRMAHEDELCSSIRRDAMDVAAEAEAIVERMMKL